MSLTVADLCDAYGLAVCELPFRDFGRLAFFCGPIATAKVFEDNSLVRRALEEPGKGRVLVVDGGGSLRCALVGDRLARLALENGWNGLVVHGAVRDSAVLATLPFPLKALGTHPRASVKKDQGTRDVPLHLGGVDFLPGNYLYADPDGIAVSATKLVT